jgi:acetyl-CoA synthetase
VVTPIVRKWIDDGQADPVAFWERAAKQVPWFRTWDRVFEWNFPTLPPQRAGAPGAPAFRWFIGGETNLAYNALDHHVERGWGGHTALIYLNERGERRLFTYASLLHDVQRVAGALRAIGLGKGDRLTVYMPTCPEAIVLMLAAVRIGAIHSVVFAGFGARALGDRIVASGSRAVFTATETWRKGKAIALKSIVDEALASSGHAVERVIVLNRSESPDAGHRAGDSGGAGREMAWDAFVEAGRGYSSAHVAMEANEPAFILATSGTTAKPKLAIHTHGGYQVHIASMGRWCFGLKSTDVWWATSDIGWIVGHSYMVYAPLIAGATTVAFEGALDHPPPPAGFGGTGPPSPPGAGGTGPRPDANWRAVVEEYGATGIFTSPTAVRMLMRYGERTLGDVDHRRLERIVCAGEVLNPHAWDWLQNRALGGRVPVIDHMWQTETGGPVFGNPYGISNAADQAGFSSAAAAGHRGRRGEDRRRAMRPRREGHHGADPPLPGDDAGTVG